MTRVRSMVGLYTRPGAKGQAENGTWGKFYRKIAKNTKGGKVGTGVLARPPRGEDAAPYPLRKRVVPHALDAQGDEDQYMERKGNEDDPIITSAYVSGRDGRPDSRRAHRAIPPRIAPARRIPAPVIRISSGGYSIVLL